MVDVADQIKSSGRWDPVQLPSARTDFAVSGPVIGVPTAQISPRSTEASSTVSSLPQGNGELPGEGKVQTSLPRSPPAAAAHVHRLKEPVSTRKRATKEEILLLRASVVNGCKFPPWQKNPSSSEFVLEDGSEPFT
jgi:calpain-7